MHEALLMDMLNCQYQLIRVVKHHGNWHSISVVLFVEVSQVPTPHILKHHVDFTGVLLILQKFEELDDIGMVTEFAQCLNLPHQPVLQIEVTIRCSLFLLYALDGDVLKTEANFQSVKKRYLPCCRVCPSICRRHHRNLAQQHHPFGNE